MGKRIIDLTTAADLTGEEFLAVDDGSADGTTQKTKLSNVSDFIQKNTYGSNLMTRYILSGGGWKRVLKYEATGATGARGDGGYGELIKINSSYSTVNPVYRLISFAAGYGQSNFLNIHSIDVDGLVTKIRHTIDKNTNTSYIEIYYNKAGNNGLSVSVLANSIGSANPSQIWQPTNGESTKETVDGVEVISSLDLPSGISGVGQSN